MRWAISAWALILAQCDAAGSAYRGIDLVLLLGCARGGQVGRIEGFEYVGSVGATASKSWKDGIMIEIEMPRHLDND